MTPEGDPLMMLLLALVAAVAIRILLGKEE